MQNKDSDLIQKSIKVKRNRWTLAMKKAKEEQISLNGVIRLLIDAWLDGDIKMTMRADKD